MYTAAADDSRILELPGVARRFLRYVTIDTRSDPESPTVPSTASQKDLSRLLARELEELGVKAEIDEFGYVFAALPPIPERPDPPRLGLLAHVDTSPDEPGAARPMVHFDYDGGAIPFSGDPALRLDPSRSPELLDHVHEDVITSDGTTLLGSDDKAGVAVLMQLAEDLMQDTKTPRPALRLCFTIDEEIGRGVDHLDLARLDSTVAYTIDGGDVGTLYAETFNAAEAVLDIEGVMVHPGYAKGIMVNALRIFGDFVTMLPSAEAPETTEEREGYIHPHTIFDSDPSHVRAKIILRDFSEDGLERRKRYLEELVELLKAKYPKAQIALTIQDQYRNMRSYIESTDPRAVSFAHAAAATIGIELEERVVRGGTDGARLSELGIPTPNVFNGGHNFHSRFEWNTVQSLELSLRYVKALVRYWGENG